ncbi:MAG: cyclic nucleotide-binding domain-containing protein, partial [bacterium]|nr:cyclic nucleotide-binding domain-containing protein [bacterium]
MVESGDTPTETPESQRRIPVVSWLVDKFREVTQSKLETAESPQDSADSAVLDAQITDVDYVDPLSQLEALAAELPDGKYLDIVNGIISYTEEHGSAELQRHEYSDGELLIDQTKPNDQLHIITDGSVRIFKTTYEVDPEDEHCTLLTERSGFNIVGEISSSGLTEEGRATASVASMGNTFALSLPATAYKTMLSENENAKKANTALSKERLVEQRELKEKSYTDAASVMAELRLLSLDLDSTMADPLEAIRTLSAEHPHVFETIVVKEGNTIIEQDTEIDHVYILLNGIGSVEDKYSLTEFATVARGSPLGEISALSPDKKTTANVIAKTNCTLMKMPAHVYQLVRKESERLVKSRLGKEKRPSVGGSTAFAGVISPDYLRSLLELAKKREHYTAQRTTLNTGSLIRTGDADQMLMLLSRRGLLEWNGTSGWEIQKQQDDNTYVINRAGESEPVTISREGIQEFIDDNLDMAFTTEADVNSQLDIYVKNKHGIEFSQEEARFLVGLGYMLSPNISEDKMQRLKDRLPGIREAVFYVRTELGEQNELLANALEQLLVDVDYPLTVTDFLHNPDTRKATLDTIIEVAGQHPVTKAEFQKKVFDTFARLDPAFTADDKKFNEDPKGLKYVDEIRTMKMETSAVHRADDDPSEEVMTKLEKHIDKRNTKVEPELVKKLGKVVGQVNGRKDGFPVISSRTKNAPGVVDKIKRMRRGNDGKDPRPEYCMADIPDITGGRVVTRNADQLEKIIRKLEDEFKGQIIEKDNFYGNESKRMKPYRVITYTVLVHGEPCEIQLTTLAASIAADINHNTIYKPIAATSKKQQELLDNIMKQAALLDTKSITQHNLNAAITTLEQYDVHPQIREQFRDRMDYGFTVRKFMKYLNEESVYTPEEKIRIK